MLEELTLSFLFLYTSFMNDDLSSSLLGKTDPAPVEVLCGDKLSDLVLVCEHAGRAVPENLAVLVLVRRY